MARDRIYLDHAATTPVLAEARAAMADALGAWANPSSPHAEGRSARAAFEAARAAIAGALDWRHDVILTSGASEAIAIVAARAKAERRLIGATEHEAVVAAMGPDALPIPVDERGLVELAELERALTGAPALVAVQQVNNETGVIQPIAEVAAMVRA
uniref:aminotransferase class V-fold PLP-dependent enzyme n=1 Tax=Sphingomonas sp. TaxID=28214 RepID=UPI00286CF25A